MKTILCALVLACISIPARANDTGVCIEKNQNGFTLKVDGADFMVKGMNWNYYPIGAPPGYSLWEESDTAIKSVLDREMTLLKEMGVNALRIRSGIPRNWIAYIFRNFGMYTMLNHPFGRYGLTLDGQWTTHTRYDRPKVRQTLLRETTAMVKEYKDTPGLLLYLLGNENNYGLHRSDVPKNEGQGKRKGTALDHRGMYKLFLLGKKGKKDASTEDTVDGELAIAERAKALYTLMNQAAIAMKSIDSSHPIALCNGDLMFIEIIRQACPDIDIFGTNMYRGMSFGDSFQRVAEELGKPILFTELGADAYDVIENKEDQQAQAYYLMRNWKEVYSNAAGIGGGKNCIGGFTYQFSDVWWKSDPNGNFDIQDTTATWHNGGYFKDDKNGAHNMNEEWFGVCSKVPVNTHGDYTLMPRLAYYALQKIHGFSPYRENTTLVEVEHFFKGIGLNPSGRFQGHDN